MHLAPSSVRQFLQGVGVVGSGVVGTVVGAGVVGTVVGGGIVVGAGVVEAVELVAESESHFILLKESILPMKSFSTGFPSGYPTSKPHVISPALNIPLSW